MTKKITQISIDEMDDLPTTIYKYRDWKDKYHKEIISDLIVFMARPSSFEDPLDCKSQKRYDLLTNDEIYKKYYLKSKEDHLDWTRNQHREFARNWFKKSPMRDKEYVKNKQKEHYKMFDDRFGVLSLTADPRNIKMWEKYSDNHRGFCVGFNTKKMFNFLGGGGIVTYVDKLPIILPFDDFDDEHHKQVFYKEKKWEFEKEYRTANFYQEPALTEERKIKLSKECYAEIIFGVNQPDQEKLEIINVCEKQDLKIDFYYEEVKDNKIELINKPSR